MHTFLILLPTAIVTFFVVVVLVLYRANLASQGARLAALLPNDVFAASAAHIDEMSTRDTDPVFWKDSDGLRGALLRLQVSMLMVAICQSQVQASHASAQDRNDILRQAFMQVWYTLFALPEAAICWVWRGCPRLAARLALQLSVRVATLSLILCEDGGDSACLAALNRVL